MKKFILKRLGLAAISLFLLSLTIFLLIRISGDPAVLLAEPGASAADLEAIRNQFGLNRPLWIQYVSFISHLFRADFGQSFYYRTDVFPRASSPRCGSTNGRTASGRSSRCSDSRCPRSGSAWS